MLSADLRSALAAMTDTTDIPWDRAVGEAYFPPPPSYNKALDQDVVKQGYVDMVEPMTSKQATGLAVSLLVRKPTLKTTFIKDPKNLMKSAAEVTKLVVQRITGGNAPDYGAFGFDSSDSEIYADGYDGFSDGQWGYNVTQAMDNAQNDTLKSKPPKVTVARVKGKTGEGWKIDVSQSYQYYLDAGLKAAEEKAEDLDRKGIYPENAGGSFNYLPAGFADKWRKKGAKAESTRSLLRVHLTQVLEATKKQQRDAEKRWAQHDAERRFAQQGARRRGGVECVRCGKELSNDREYGETPNGPVCNTCGAKAGLWR